MKHWTWNCYKYHSDTGTKGNSIEDVNCENCLFMGLRNAKDHGWREDTKRFMEQIKRIQFDEKFKDILK